MGKIIKYEKFFAYSSVKNKYFYTEFNDGINVIYGKNTSGKSTLIQAILYTFGINDEKYKLKEILDENVFFRLDFVLLNNTSEKVIFIRENDFMIIKRENQLPKKFLGISANNSNEHILLKKYVAELLGSNLYLQTKDGYKTAAIEAIFLPYYVAQDVGWIARHKSFRDLDFVKNFKEDFFDYYLGIVNNYDRERKTSLEKIKASIKNEISFLKSTESESEQFQLSKLQDEQYLDKSNEYLDQFKINKEKLIELEKKYLELCNTFSFKEKQKKLLSNILRALNKQRPAVDKCPTCNRVFSDALGNIYEYHQNRNDTVKQIENIKITLKSYKSEIDSIQVKIKTLKNTILKKYNILATYKISDLTFTDRINNKANIKLSEEICRKIGKKEIELQKILDDLKDFKTDEQIKNERNNFSHSFKNTFKEYLKELKVKYFDEEQYYLLYQMPTHLPYQGVELLKAMHAYNFAFVNLIGKLKYTHKLPLLLDAIFKEDIDEENRSNILKFIYKNRAVNHQIIMTVASSKDNTIKIEDYNLKYLNNEAKLICINNVEERAFLTEYKKQHEEYLNETLEYLS